MSDPVTNLTDGLRKVFLAGVGAAATVGEKGGQVVDALAERGESVVKQGRDLNQELAQKGAEATSGVREDVLRATMAAMSPAARSDIASMVGRVADELNARDAAAAAQAAKGPATIPVEDAAAGEPGAAPQGEGAPSAS